MFLERLKGKDPEIRNEDSSVEKISSSDRKNKGQLMFKQNLDELTQGLDFFKSNFEGLHHQLVLDLTIVMSPSTSFKFVRDEQGHCVMYYRNYSHMRWEGPQRLIEVCIVFSCSMCIVRKNPYFYEPKGN